MTIRARLLALLLPTFIAFIALIFLFFYFNWYREIVTNFNLELQAVAEGGVQVMDREIKLIEEEVHEATLALVLSSLLIIALVVAAIYLIANAISKPVQKLKNAAFAIAAGDYAASIQVQGPKEIVELAHAFNTMNECLQENIQRLQESSFACEQLRSEQECAHLLQHYMLAKVIAQFQHDFLTLHLIKQSTLAAPHGLRLQIQQKEEVLHFAISEAKESGFLPIFHLLSQEEKEKAACIDIAFAPDFSHFTYTIKEMPVPFVWQRDKATFAHALEGNKNGYPLYPGDWLFFYNKGFEQLFDDREQTALWIAKILKHFGKEEPSFLIPLFQNELHFLSKKQHARREAILLAAQLRA